jgi:hypothetical protein
MLNRIEVCYHVAMAGYNNYYSVDFHADECRSLRMKVDCRADVVQAIELILLKATKPCKAKVLSCVLPFYGYDGTLNKDVPESFIKEIECMLEDHRVTCERNAEKELKNFYKFAEGYDSSDKREKILKEKIIKALDYDPFVDEFYKADDFIDRAKEALRCKWEEAKCKNAGW